MEEDTSSRTRRHPFATQRRRPRPPPRNGKVDPEVDDLLADELLKLSFGDRNAIAEEIHGVRSLAVPETPELLRQALHAFGLELELLPPEHTPAYRYIRAYRQKEAAQWQQQRMQQQMHPHRTPQQPPPMFANYADDDAFRLRFLRACLFDVGQAVRRFCNYLNFVQRHWGNGGLARLVGLGDFTPTEQRLLKRGWHQLLPFRDRRGRRIVCGLGDGSDMDEVASVKVFFYVLDAATRDSIESQRNGIVQILDGSRWKDGGDRSTNMIREKLKTIVQTRSLAAYAPILDCYSAVPSRIVGVHFCWPNSPILRMLSNWYLFRTDLVTSQTSALHMSRIKFHGGDATEMRYHVKSYGIPIELLPLTGTHAIKVGYHHQWIKTRKLVETNQARFQEHRNRLGIAGGYQPEYECEYLLGNGNDGKKPKSKQQSQQSKPTVVTVVECPCSTDVVFRNGTQSMENPGNAMFRNSILNYWEGKERQKLEKLDESRGSGDTRMETSTNATITQPAKTAGTTRSSSTSPVPSDESLDRDFREQLVRDIEDEKGGRFLEWDKGLGVWVQLRDKTRIHRKVGMAFYNCTKRRYHHKVPPHRPQQPQASSTTTSSASTETRRRRREPVVATSNALSEPNVMAYQFIDGESLQRSRNNAADPRSFCHPQTTTAAHAGYQSLLSAKDGRETNQQQHKRSCLSWPFAVGHNNYSDHSDSSA